MPEPVQARSIATLEKIMVAAEAVVARAGAGGLTMDAVAQEAGISKGGLLHHFRSKEALIARLASRKLETLREEMERATALYEGAANRSLGAIIGHASATYGRDDGFSRAMLTAAVENSQSLERFKAVFADSFARVRAESAEPDAAAALLFAVIGMQMSRTMGFAELDRGQAEAVFRALQGLASSLPSTMGGVRLRRPGKGGPGHGA